MSATELEELQALLERALPDPRRFAGRLLRQAVTQYGLLTEPAPTASYAAEDTPPGENIIVADQWPADQTPVDTNILLAAALGACECWGLEPDCDLCQGQGTAGWSQPDPELFEEFVRPAIERLPAMPPQGCKQHDRPGTDDDHDDHPTVQGENA